MAEGPSPLDRLGTSGQANLKPAPFALTPGVVRGLVGDGPVGSGIALLPIGRQMRLPIHPMPHVAHEPSGEDPTRPSTGAGTDQDGVNDNSGGGGC